MEEKNLLAEMAYQFPVVGTNEDRGSLLIDCFEKTHDFKSQFRIKIACGLIGQDDFWIVDDGSGNGDSLLFSVRELGRVIPDLVVKVDHAQGCQNLFSQFLLRDTQDLEHDGHIVKHLFMKEETEVLENYPHCPPDLINFMIRNFQNVSAVDNDLSLGGEGLTKNDFKKGRFPCSAGTGNEPEISSLDMQSDIGKCPMRFMVLFGKSIEFNHFQYSLFASKHPELQDNIFSF